MWLEDTSHSTWIRKKKWEAHFAYINAVYKFNDSEKDRFSPYLSTGFGFTPTAFGTFAFKIKLLNETKYDDDAEFAEEKQFLKNYTIPFIQLDPIKTILCFPHDKNTFDKQCLIKIPDPDKVKETKLKLKIFMKDKKIAKQYSVQKNIQL